MGSPSIRSALPDDFASRYWRKQPLLIRGSASDIASLTTEEEIDRFEADFFSAPASWRTNSVGKIGSTSYIGNGECINEEMAEFCAQFRQEFNWPHAEIALVRNRETTSWIPSGPHFDQVDNFIIQGPGVKQWRLWSTATVGTEEKRRRVLKLPQYGEFAIPDDAMDLVEITMEPGDLLYVPLFWGHSVRALGPGLMYSVNLKALLASQILLSGVTRSLGTLDTDPEPMPLPFEVEDWPTEMRTRMARAFAVVTDFIAPSLQGESSAPVDSSGLCAAGIDGLASKRHELLQKSVAPTGVIRPGEHLQAVEARLRATRLDLASPLTWPPSPEAMSALVEVMSLVHLYRFLGLLALGPQAWWPASVGNDWRALREHIEGIELQTLIQCAADPGLIHQTKLFRDDLLAFNRRHALTTLRGWVDLVEWLVPAPATAGISVFSDASGQMPSEPEIQTEVQEALAEVDEVWPAFSASFGVLTQAITADRLGRQASVAGRRARTAVVHPQWRRDELAPALVGELARVGADTVARLGIVVPGAVPCYGDDWLTQEATITRISALLGAAAYLEAAGMSGRAAAHRGLATELLRRVNYENLTRLGRDLADALTRASRGEAPGAAAPSRQLFQTLEEIGSHQSADSRELVQGHTQPNARFRWSDLRRDDSFEIGFPVGVGMDLSIPPWLAR